MDVISVLTTLMSCQFQRLCPPHTLFQCFAILVSNFKETCILIKTPTGKSAKAHFSAALTMKCAKLQCFEEQNQIDLKFFVCCQTANVCLTHWWMFKNFFVDFVIITTFINMNLTFETFGST